VKISVPSSTTRVFCWPMDRRLTARPACDGVTQAASFAISVAK
jgi:hypothetical protein